MGIRTAVQSPHRRRARSWVALAIAFGLFAGCGDDPVDPGDDNGNGGPPPDLGPFSVTEIFLRPYAIQRPSPANGLPTPSLVEHYLTAFYQGGDELATFEWEYPTELGPIEPATPTLDRNQATVILRIRSDGNPALGFFDVEAHGTSGTETGSFRQRFAVVDNRWMKHRRIIFTATEPADLVSGPTFLSGGATGVDSIFYAENANVETANIQFVTAFASLNGPEPVPTTPFLPPLLPVPNNYQTASKMDPDLAPPATRRRDLLFTSDMDPQYPDRCPGDECATPPPRLIWVARLPAGFAQFEARPLTFDSRVSGRWLANDSYLPKWDPSATQGERVRIAFLGERAPHPDSLRSTNLYVGDLLDLGADGVSDTLVDVRAVTNFRGGGSIVQYDWHPDGTRVCAFGGGGLYWIDIATGNQTPIAIPDASLEVVTSPTVFWRAGEHTLVAFQAQSENLSNLYVWDEQDNTVTRVLPFAVPVSHNLFPRFHRTRKQIVYVSDYTVAAWSNSTGSSGIGDRFNPLTNGFAGQQRTLYPSPWVLSLE